MCVSGSDDVEERIRFLESGADDVVARPLDARELEARVEALLLRFQRSHLAPIISADGLTMHRARRTVAVFSPKGGVGTTTIAANIAIAAVACNRRTVWSSSTCRSSSGAWRRCSTSIRSRRSPTSCATSRRCVSRTCCERTPCADRQRPARPRRTGRARGRRERHPGPCDPDPPDAPRLRHDRDRRGIVARRAGPGDLRGSRDGHSCRCTPEIAALKAVHALLEYLSEVGSVVLKTTFVLNDVFAREHPQGCVTSRTSSARRSRSSCRTTRSCTSRPRTRACPSSRGPRNPRPPSDS